MSYSNHKLSAIAGAVFVGVALFLYALSAHANPLRFAALTSTAAATTTLVYMTPGTATTTVTYDSFANGGGTQAYDKVAFLMQTTASSTSSVYNVAVQYSQDGIDWYGDTYFPTATTSITNVQTPSTFTLKSSGTAVYLNALNVAVPTRFVRAQVSITGANGAVWAQMVGQKQGS